ncbi:UPF0481 protein At3g47200-like [Ananas comosus]|uniref:UPF0481 protein At3g47200-like n=1 Tax=Ananas comosus TaxID=4615 RepID=A0A6P5GFX4_ANACO|nr:UPF0481 protein At3g47200-like [Ananas comosus]
MATGERQWVVDVRNRLKDVNLSAEMEQWGKHSIYRVPSCIKDLDPKAYKPQVVSFGPFHHGEAHLQPMEEHKQRALMHFLRRPNVPFEFDDLVAAVYEVVQPLQDAYQKLEEVFSNKDRFVELMIVDGCFMLEVIRVTAGRSSDYASNDPIFSRHGVLYTVPYIRRDMLMIENQLPLLVLEKLIAVETGKPMNEDLINRLVLKFLSPASRPLAAGLGLGLHPLDVFRKSMLQSPPRGLRRRTTFEPASSEIIRSAVELYEAGIRFKKSKTESLRDIQFKHGVLSLPVIVVDDSTEYMFLNLMAFERLHVGAGNEVTSYVFFMDNIVDSSKDVSLLNSRGIIQNAIGSDKAVAKLFNSLSKDVVLDPESSLDDVHRMVSEYCRKPWNMWRANLIHTYFRSPWAFLSLAAAIFLLVMTIMQTVYTVMPYYQSKSSSPPLPPPPFAPSPQ